MQKLLIWGKVTVAALMLTLGVAGTVATPVFATDESEIQPRDSEVMPIHQTEKPKEIVPTFSAETANNDQSAIIKIGNNLLIAGNNLIADRDVDEGISLIAGNNVTVNNQSEYGFVFGNIITLNGMVERDLFIAGNQITLDEDAVIGRDVYTASDSLTVNTNIHGDLSATASTVVLKDVTIDGNVNLSVANVRFEGKVEIAGKLTYNDDAVVSGKDNVTYREIEAYHVEKLSQGAMILGALYGKFLSIASLFLVMVLVIAFAPKLHAKIENESNTSRFGINLAVGLVVLVALPVVSLVAFMTVVAAPVGLIALMAYLIMIYLSQGFAGLWLGHVILEKLCKVKASKANAYIEALIGIVILGILSLIPYLGTITGFLGLVLGLGLIFRSVKPTKTVAEAETSATKSEE